uniref:RNA-dependent RNA polymerase n=1 Tax=Crocidura lasiura ribovirus 9 TaxID=3139505 RepID=A0AB38ZJV3_9VIRU
MPVVRLPRQEGFAQRHLSSVKPSLYLRALHADTGYWRSPVTLPLIRRDVLQFSNDKSLELDPLMKYAICLTRRAFALSEAQPMLHLNDLFDYDLNIWKRSPGLPWRNIGYRTKADVRDDPNCRRSIRWFWHRIKNGEKLGAPDCSAFVRSHIADIGEHKVRAVWGYPMTMTLGEAVFAVPLIEAYQKSRSPIAYGYETAVGGTRKIVTEFSGSAHYAALDFKAFDKTVPRELIDVAFDILGENLNFVNYRDHGIADARRNAIMFDYIKHYFINTTIRLCNGERYRKRSGIASGSYFTQLVGSVVNHILVTWVYLRLTGRPPRHIKVLGDDSITGGSSSFSLDDAADLIKSIGMELNVSKSAVTRDISRLTFLGYTINDGAPTKPFARWLAALLYPEFPDRSWDVVASRALGLNYACFGQDDKFDHMTRVIVRLKKFDLALDASMSRMLEMIGFSAVSTSLPSKLEYLQRLRLL